MYNYDVNLIQIFHINFEHKHSKFRVLFNIEKYTFRFTL